MLTGVETRSPDRAFTGHSREAAEAAARRTLRSQIADLDARTAALAAEAFPKALELPAIGGGSARMLDIAELEARRDAMANRLEDARRRLAGIRSAQSDARALVERMLADPDSHRWVRVSRDEAGLPGCGHWHVRPRLGLIGMLAGWWHVKISSGCPLAGHSGMRRAHAV